MSGSNSSLKRPQAVLLTVEGPTPELTVAGGYALYRDTLLESGVYRSSLIPEAEFSADPITAWREAAPVILRAEIYTAQFDKVWPREDRPTPTILLPDDPENPFTVIASRGPLAIGWRAKGGKVEIVVDLWGAQAALLHDPEINAAEIALGGSKPADEVVDAARDFIHATRQWIGLKLADAGVFDVSSEGRTFATLETSAESAARLKDEIEAIEAAAGSLGAPAFTPGAFRKFSRNGVTFDQTLGKGSVPAILGVGMDGFIAEMRPSAYLSVCSQLSDSAFHRRRVAEIKEMIQAGVAMGMPFLKIDPKDDVPEIQGHEGRHRMAALMELTDDAPVPVAFLLRHSRASQIDVDYIAKVSSGVVRERWEGDPHPPFIDGPLFEQVVHLGKTLEIQPEPSLQMGL